MKFVSSRELRINPGTVWKRLRQEQDLVVTSNGKPIAVSTLAEGGIDEEAVLDQYLNRTTRDWHSPVGAKHLRVCRLLCGYAVGKCFAPTQRRVRCANVLWSDLGANAMSEDAMNLYIGIEAEALLIPSTRKVSAPRLPAARRSKLVRYLPLLYKYLYKYYTRIQGWTLFPTLMLVVNSRR